MVNSRDVKCFLYFDVEWYWKLYEEVENEELFVRELILDVCFVVKLM